MEKVLEVKHLQKSFGAVKAVSDISFTVFKGDIYGFLGPNGSGKSTTIRMVLNLIKPDAGEVLVFGEPLGGHRKQALSKIGALIERPDFYQYLPPTKILTYWRNIQGLRGIV